MILACLLLTEFTRSRGDALLYPLTVKIEDHAVLLGTFVVFSTYHILTE